MKMKRESSTRAFVFVRMNETRNERKDERIVICYLSLPIKYYSSLHCVAFYFATFFLPLPLPRVGVDQTEYNDTVAVQHLALHFLHSTDGVAGALLLYTFIHNSFATPSVPARARVDKIFIIQSYRYFSTDRPTNFHFTRTTLRCPTPPCRASRVLSRFADRNFWWDTTYVRAACTAAGETIWTFLSRKVKSSYELCCELRVTE